MKTTWDRRAVLYDLCEGSDLRRGIHKRALFQQIRGRALFVAVGTGIDIKHLPIDSEIIGIDYSGAMITKSRSRAERYPRRLSLLQCDAGNLAFADGTFDTVVTSCTMCSVPSASTALGEIHRVLRPEGRLLMFEHVRSKNTILGLILDTMTLLTRRRGTEMNRDTLVEAAKRGFHIIEVKPVFLDIILAVVAMKARPVT